MQLKYELAIAIIKHFEGFRSTPYYCSSGVLTIGYGRTKNVRLRDTTTWAKEDHWLINEVLKINSFINQVVEPYMSPSQMAALISFIYNVGLGNFNRSTLLKRLNNEDKRASDELLRWTKGSSGLNLPGLVRRRKTEKHLFDTGEIEYYG